MKRLYLFLAVVFLVAVVSETAVGQAAGDYRTRASGNWDGASTWQVFAGTWVDTAVSPTDITAGMITILNTHTVTVTAAVAVDQVMVDSGGQITINSGITLTVFNGTGVDLTINGNVTNNGAITRGSGATFTIGSGGRYVHNTSTTANGAAWTSLSSNSNFEYQDATGLSTAPTYGNLIINTGGNVTLGSGTLGVAGNMTIQSGAFRIVNTAGTSATVNLTGDLILTGSFTGNVGGAGLATLNLGGSVSSGSFSAGAGAGGFVLTFTGGASSVTFAPTSAYSSDGNVTVANTPIGKTVTLGSSITMNTGHTLTVNGALNCGTNIVSGAGTFTLGIDGTLGIGDPSGITSSGATGNIQTTTRNYDPATPGSGNFTYNGTAAQDTGNGLPATVSLLTDSNTGGIVTLQSNPVTTTLAIPLAGANLKIASAKTLTLDGSSTIIGTLSGAGATFLFKGVTFTNSGTVGVETTTFNRAPAGTQNLGGTGSWTGAGTFTFAGNGNTVNVTNVVTTLAVGAILIDTATLVIGTNTLNFPGATFTNNGAFTAGSGGKVVFNGTVAQTINGSASTPFAALTISNTGGGSTNMTTSCSASGLLTLSSDLTVTDPASLTQSGTSTGTGDVVGGVRRTDVNGTPKSFGNANVQIANGGTATEVRVFLVKGSAPSGFTGAVKRVYSITPASGSVSGATVQLRYLDSELNGNTEGSLTLWRATGSPTATWQDQGFTTRDATDDFVAKTGVAGFSSWTLADGAAGPTAVRLTQFNAASFADGVQLSWESGYEVNNLGYHLYRQQNGQRTRVTPSLVAGSALTVGPGSHLTAGYSYSWFDPQGTPNSVYSLEAIDLDGSSQWAGAIYPSAGSGSGRGRKAARHERALLLNEIAADERDQSSVSSWPAAMERSTDLSLLASGANNADWARGTDQSGARPPHSREGLDSKESPDSKAKLNSMEGPAPLGIQQAIAAGKAVKIQVQKSGWYRVTQSELVAAGFDPASDARMLQLYVGGEEVPISLSAEGTRLGANDTMEFYGVPLDTPTTDTQVYWLISGSSSAKRMIARRGKLKPAEPYSETVSGSFNVTTERRDRVLYSAGILNGDGDNLFGAPVRPDPVNQNLVTRNVDRESVSQSQLEVALQGLTTGAHTVRLQINGANVGTMTFADREHQVAKFSVSQSLLREGDNVVSLASANGQSDISLIDWVRLTYPRQYKAENNALRFSAVGGQPVKIEGFSNPNVRVVDVTNPNSPAQLSASATSSGGAYAVKVQPAGTGVRTLIAFTDDLMGQPVSITANQPSNWSAGTNGADMLIITHKHFRQAIEPLANLRRSQGLNVAVIDVEDIYDEFSYGAHTPAAIKSFLMSAAANWKPAYLLLVGDSSWDPRNYLNRGENDFVPTKLIDTQFMETGSDDWLADFNGVGLANMAVGRLPARTVAEVHLMVSKIMSYEQERELNAPLRGALMVADRGFEPQSSQTRALLPSYVTVQTINRADVGSDDVMRGQIVDALNQGPMIVNYYGHGSVKVWTGEGLLSSDLASTLTNTNRLSVFVMMTCLNGYASDANIDSLGEATLKAPNGGAVAVWASSGFTTPQPQFEMNAEFYRLLFGGQPQRLGDAARSAKAATSDLDVRRTWILLGDPAMRVR